MAKKKYIKQQAFRGKILLVCGGSKGIGKETAKQIVRLGGSVGVVARDPAALGEAAQEIEAVKATDSQFVETIACDTTDMDVLKPKIEAFIEAHGVPDVLVNLVGYAYPQYVHKLTLDDFKKNMDVNYYGQLVPTLILLPHYMKANKGHIAFVSSLGGVIGAIGYASYTPTKAALVGLSEVLRHELKPYNIKISVLYPSDTETPGFEIENQTKPPETAMISEAARVFSAEKVAEAFVEGLLKEKLTIDFGITKIQRILFRLAPGLVHAIIDSDLKKARKKLGKL
ncbi:MAG: SDR family oxidoreductase [Anaerolineales bacterium]|jgi:3-dehydrosphinganine reductase